MLTLSAFLLVAGSVFGSVWWACKTEETSPAAPSENLAPL
jgi:hypothetical protein